MKRVGVAVFVAALALSVIALPLAGASPGDHATGHTAAVFISTNGAAANDVVAYERSDAGTLNWVGSFSTGGTGTGAALGDSGALAISSNSHWLLAVDAGSNQVSVFQVNLQHDGPMLFLTDVTGSDGVLPVSVSISGNVVYVLNAGNSETPGNIAGFILNHHGQLSPLTGSVQSLSTSGATGAAQISFNPAGTLLVVTEKTTDVLDVYAVNGHGVAGAATTYASSGGEPYGFDFAGNHHVIVSEASTGTVSSYSLGRAAGLQLVSGAISDTQGAPCWVVVTGNAKIAYISNTASGTISSFGVGPGGTLTLLQAVAAATDAGPAYSAISSGSHFLYIYAGGVGAIDAFQIQRDGTLAPIQAVGGLPIGSEGLVAT